MLEQVKRFLQVRKGLLKFLVLKPLKHSFTYPEMYLIPLQSRIFITNGLHEKTIFVVLDLQFKKEKKKH